MTFGCPLFFLLIDILVTMSQCPDDTCVYVTFVSLQLQILEVVQNEDEIDSGL